MTKNNYTALWITGICIIIFIIQVISPLFTEAFKLTTSEALVRPWTLITAIFLHGSITHLLYNMFALALFGTILEHNIGTKKFLYLFFSAGLFASIASIPFYNAVLGASGAIFGIIGALAIIKPKMVVWFYGMPMPMVLAAIFWVAIDVLGIFAPSNTANIAHISGVLVGVVFGILLRSKFIQLKKQEITMDNKSIEEWEARYMK